MALACSVGLVVSVRVCVCVCMHNLEEGCEENGAQSEKLGEASTAAKFGMPSPKSGGPQRGSPKSGGPQRGLTPSGAMGGEVKEVGKCVGLPWWSGKRPQCPQK
jgi:hypothetical protein